MSLSELYPLISLSPARPRCPRASFIVPAPRLPPSWPPFARRFPIIPLFLSTIQPYEVGPLLALAPMFLDTDFPGEPGEAKEAAEALLTSPLTPNQIFQLLKYDLTSALWTNVLVHGGRWDGW